MLEGWVIPKCKKKALLIGIKDDTDENTVELAGPHRDVLALKQLLIDAYGYEEENITIMLDGGKVDERLTPTRANILREIKNLVQGAQAGDRFLFHFSGHSKQITNITGTEDDGMDEALVTSDNKSIIDNLLKKYLVKPLPVGCTLVAIFDTCHSASLLDLRHHRCNRVYVPWVSRVGSSMRVSEYRRTSTDRMDTKESSLSITPPNSRRRTTLSVKTKSTLMVSPTELPSVEEEEQHKLVFGGTSILASPEQFCASPVQSEPDCDGFHSFSLSEDSGFDEPQVIALGACKDAQIAWEAVDGESMTSALIDILKTNPHPCLNELMVDISHRTYEMCCRLHEAWKQWKDAYCAHGAVRTPEFENLIAADPSKGFQDPQLASNVRLNMNLRFSL